MKFICPICETGGSISPDKLVSPITKTTCQKCGTILLANPDSGKIDAYKSPFKGTGESDAVSTLPDRYAVSFGSATRLVSSDSNLYVSA